MQALSGDAQPRDTRCDLFHDKGMGQGGVDPGRLDFGPQRQLGGAAQILPIGFECTQQRRVMHAIVRRYRKVAVQWRSGRNRQTLFQVMAVGRAEQAIVSLGHCNVLVQRRRGCRVAGRTGSMVQPLTFFSGFVSNLLLAKY